MLVNDDDNVLHTFDRGPDYYPVGYGDDAAFVNPITWWGQKISEWTAPSQPTAVTQTIPTGTTAVTPASTPITGADIQMGISHGNNELVNIVGPSPSQTAVYMNSPVTKVPSSGSITGQDASMMPQATDMFTGKNIAIGVGVLAILAAGYWMLSSTD